MRTRLLQRGVAPAIATMLLAGCGGGTHLGAATDTAAPTSGDGAPSAGPTGPAAAANTLQAAYVSVVAAVLPSVVQITTDTGLGSGIVFDNLGDIVTNAHVVATATTFQVRLANSAAAVPATLVGAYRPDDLAVIHLDTIPSTAPKPAQFADSTKLQVGDIVLAMGNPLGLAGSVTEGIVSATGRTISEPTGADSPGATLPEVIQTSAAINPGNSGGALVDLAGAVVGVPTLAAVDPQIGGGAAPGIGFAIPSNLVKDIAGQLVSGHGHVSDSHRAELGVQVATVVDQDGTPTGAGVLLVSPGGPAATAGVKAGEIITAVAGSPVHTTEDLTTALAGLTPGKSVPLTLTAGAGGSARTVTVTLGQLPGT